MKRRIATLYATANAEGSVEMAADFDSAHLVFKADVLRDCLYDLEQVYNELLKKGLAVVMQAEAVMLTLEQVLASAAFRRAARFGLRSTGLGK